MITAKVTKNFDLRKLKLDLHRELNQGIDIIAENIEESIDNGQQFGMAFAPNKPATVKRKGHNKPLIDTGLMKDEGRMRKTKATTAKQEATLLPNHQRESIGFWNDQGTPNIPSRKFWGISVRADNKIDKIIDKAIRKSIERTRKASIA